MLGRNILTIFILLLLSIPGTLCAQKNSYTHPEDTVKDQLRETIEHSERSIDICIHDFVELDIYEDLEAARTRGVQVRVVVLVNHLKGTLENTLIQKGFDVRVLKALSATSGYQYFVLVDNRVLVTCVYNLEAYRHKDMSSAVRFYEDPDWINDYENTFSEMFAAGHTAPSPVTGTRDIRLIFLFIIIFFVGLVFSMFGQGGGAFFVPIMIAFAIPFHDAATTSLFIIMATSISASLVYGRSKMIDWKLALIVDPITDIMAFVSGYFAIKVSGSILTLLFAIVVMSSSYFMLRPVNADKRLSSPKRRFGRWHRKFGDYEYHANLLVAVPLSGIAGIISGLLGISGGLFKVPLLVLLCGVPMKISVATSSFMVALTGLGGFLGHSLSEVVNWKYAIFLSIAAFLGAQIGSRISIRMDKVLLKKLFGILLILISIWMIYNVISVERG